MKLKAKVKRHTGATAHFIGGINSHGRFEARTAPVTTAVEIRKLEFGWLMLYFGADGQALTDAWHASLKEAKEKPRFEFQIEEEDWELSTGERC